MQKLWNTYYLYYKGDADHLLKEVVHTSLQNIQEQLGKEVRFFFIRYFENGYHVRLRLLLSADEVPLFFSVLKDQLSNYERVHETQVVLKEAQYIPETDRYGNADTIAYAESQFYGSSQFILNNLVQNYLITTQERYLLALKTQMAFFKGMKLSQHDSLQLCHEFVESWLPVPYSENPDEVEQNRKSLLSAFQQQFDTYKAALYESLEEFRGSLDTTEDPFLQEFLEVNNKVYENYARSQLSKNQINEALLSFIHMNNNRLGIINAEESYLLFLIMQTIPLIKNYDER